MSQDKTFMINSNLMSLNKNLRSQFELIETKKKESNSRIMQL